MERMKIPAGKVIQSVPWIITLIFWGSHYVICTLHSKIKTEKFILIVVYRLTLDMFPAFVDIVCFSSVSPELRYIDTGMFII